MEESEVRLDFPRSLSSRRRRGMKFLMVLRLLTLGRGEGTNFASLMERTK